MSLHRQHLGFGLPPQTRGYQVGDTQYRGSVHTTPLRVQRCSSAPPVCAWEAQCSGELPQPRFPGIGLRMDSVPGGLPGSLPLLAGHHRPVRNVHEPLAPGVGSPGPSHRRDEPELGRPPSLCLPSVRLHSQCPRQDPSVSESGCHSSRPLLASEAMVPGRPGTSGGVPVLLPLRKDLLCQPHFHHFHQNLPTLHNWVLYCQRTARRLSFPSAVARQLACCRWSSTCVNYQARWQAYRAWCRRQGHSISRPSISKIADFLLYLRRSLHLSYSSIASYRSMLSAVFRFILPDISSHPVLHDLLRSFRIEHSLPSPRVPHWDLLRVLALLRGPPFKSLSVCSLRDLTRKVLFLVALVTARCVGELQAVSFPGMMFSSVYRSFGRRQSRPPTRFLDLLLCVLFETLSAPFLTSCFFVLSGRCVRIYRLLPFPLDCARCLFLLVLLLALSLKMP